MFFPAEINIYGMFQGSVAAPEWKNNSERILFFFMLVSAHQSLCARTSLNVVAASAERGFAMLISRAADKHNEGEKINNPLGV